MSHIVSAKITQIAVFQKKVTSHSCEPECENNSVCNTDIGYCECKVGYSGNPYKNCSRKCKKFEDCSSEESCINGVCVNPCENDCGINSLCVVKNHSSICSCPPGYIGNSFEICRPISEHQRLTEEDICDQCANDALCISTNTATNCVCPRGFFGNPYISCYKMCLSNEDCTSDKLCVHNLCKDPCEGACGVNTECTVDKIKRNPVCRCQDGFSGDPSRICTLKIENRFAADEELNCHPECGANATCDTQYGICKCKVGFIGNPYGGCRKRCEVNADCPEDRSCSSGDCIDPCLTACGKNAICSMDKHVPFCRCPYGYSGNAFEFCRKDATKPEPRIIEVDLCDSFQCGLNAKCEYRDTETCICLPGHSGNPYKKCVKKCRSNEDCAKNDKCAQGLCKDVCENGCGINAICKADNHRPKCECPENYRGDPLNICFPKKKGVLVNPSRVPCFKCICRAITGNDNIFSCAEKSIDFGYWAFAGEDLVGGEEFRTRNSSIDFLTCMNNRICILNTMNDYTSRALSRLNDINCDGEITCADMFAVHKFGLTAKFSDSIFNASEARSFDQCEGHGNKDISNNWTPKSCIGPSYVELLS
ncbi:neurogenic locus Notch protein-like isoform X2 [Harmonia axyridis]|uniref:neurogenic locus Notch protein-like isoform X2 n=1 Tax=Harmonia axyridis TaxID=115357 RepID=UPI001E27668B|nr:neurogenic locus Notch protein-like isoform X2 [Harmonia axyridis]